MTRYAVIVQAYNNVGAGPRSDEVSATTLEAGEHDSALLYLLLRLQLWLREGRSNRNCIERDFISENHSEQYALHSRAENKIRK